jgi:adenylyltransferase/sulfurtransferase
MILKKIGIIGQKKLLKSRVLIVGAGGLGSPISIYLTALGIGKIGIIDYDKVEISNLSRQIIFTNNDINKKKSSTAINRLKKINPNIKFKSFEKKLSGKNIHNIAKDFDLIVDGSDNFRTRFLINDYCLLKKKILVSGAISKFEGQIYTFNFSKKKSPCLRCFIPEMPNNPDIDNCEYEGIIGTLGGIVGSIQANEVVKEILQIGESLCGYILIIDALKLTFRKVKLNKRTNCYCYEKNK